MGVELRVRVKARAEMAAEAISKGSEKKAEDQALEKAPKRDRIEHSKGQRQGGDRKASEPGNSTASWRQKDQHLSGKVRALTQY